MSMSVAETPAREIPGYWLLSGFGIGMVVGAFGWWFLAAVNDAVSAWLMGIGLGLLLFAAFITLIGLIWNLPIRGWD